MGFSDAPHRRRSPERCTEPSSDTIAWAYWGGHCYTNFVHLRFLSRLLVN